MEVIAAFDSLQNADRQHAGGFVLPARSFPLFRSLELKLLQRSDCLLYPLNLEFNDHVDQLFGGALPVHQLKCYDLVVELKLLPSDVDCQGLCKVALRLCL